jgi:hypothetical protein
MTLKQNNIVCKNLTAQNLYDINNSSGTANQFLGKDGTNQLEWTTAVPAAITVQAANGTIALIPSMNRSTYILTGTSATQTFTTTGLTGEPAGFCVYLRNGNNATGLTKDITITIPAGSTTLHTITGTTNSSFILLYWDGSVLTAYR